MTIREDSAALDNHADRAGHLGTIPAEAEGTEYKKNDVVEYAGTEHEPIVGKRGVVRQVRGDGWVTVAFDDVPELIGRYILLSKDIKLISRPEPYAPQVGDTVQYVGDEAHEITFAFGTVTEAPLSHDTSGWTEVLVRDGPALVNYSLQAEDLKLISRDPAYSPPKPFVNPNIVHVDGRGNVRKSTTVIDARPPDDPNFKPVAPIDLTPGVVAPKSTDKTEAILQSRQGTHGSYADNARDSQAQKRYLRAHVGWERLSDEMRETLDMNAHKTARIMNGDPFVADHWDDIAGYSRLASKAVEEELRRRAEQKAPDKVGW